MESTWCDINQMGFPNEVLHTALCVIVVEETRIGYPDREYPATWNNDKRQFEGYGVEICKDDNVIAWTTFPSYSRGDSGRPWNMIGALGGKEQ